MFKIVPSEEGTTPEQAMEAFNKQYVSADSMAERLHEFEDQKNKVFAKVAGSIDSKLNKEAKELGLSLEGKTTENVELIVSTLKSKITELEEKYQNALTNPEAKAEIDTLTQKLADRDTLIKKLQGDFEQTLEQKTQLEQSYTAKEKQLIVSSKLEAAKSQFILIEDKNTRDACQLDLMLHKFELDEAGNEIVRNQSGEIILSTVKTGYADYKEVLNSVYTNRNAHKKIQGAGEIKPIGINEDTKVLNNRTLAPR